MKKVLLLMLAAMIGSVAAMERDDETQEGVWVSRKQLIEVIADINETNERNGRLKQEITEVKQQNARLEQMLAQILRKMK